MPKSSDFFSFSIIFTSCITVVPTCLGTKIPAWYKEHRQSLISSETARVYKGYLEIARRYLWKSFDDPIHPLSYE